MGSRRQKEHGSLIMVGIVFVSHSAKIAEGVRDLAGQMVQGSVPLAVAGGTDDPENGIGTDAVKIAQAIRSVYSEDGVVVLMDLGSAILSAETALEFLEPEQRERVSLSAAPLVEGAVAAAVTASGGGTREAIVAEARNSLAMKTNHLQQEPPQEQRERRSAGKEKETTLETLVLTIRNRMGLHARPAAQFVQTANRFDADIDVRKGSKRANAKSINEVALLGVRQGETIEVSASGAGAADSLAALKALVESGFGEPSEADEDASEQRRRAGAGDDVLEGVAVSPGVVVGPALLYRPHLPAVVDRPADDAATEWFHLGQAIAAAEREISALEKQTRRQLGANEAAIFQAHALFLEDAVFLERIKKRIFSEAMAAEVVWAEEIGKTAKGFRALENRYMQARASDIEDVGRRVLQHLLGVNRPSLEFEKPSILVAADLSPSDTAELEAASVLGLCLEAGGATAHSAILARGLGIPAVVGVGKGLWEIQEGELIGIDGETGQLWPHPDEEQQATLRRRQASWQKAQEKAKLAGREAAVTRDGHGVEVAANIGRPNDVTVALEYGAEGVGLFRTEFLFMDRDAAPQEEEQYLAYARVARALGKRPLIIRTLDIGGDKQLPYLDLGREDNPFLGWRGIRFCLDRPEILRPQLRAILRASTLGNVKLMFPMIGAIEEIRMAKALLQEEKQDLRLAGIDVDESMEVGVMIEVPSAVAMADQLAAEVDFFSIGTNDLAQYTMAADRGNAHVAELVKALQPAVLRFVKQTVEAAHAADIWVGVCGELAGKAVAVPLLVGLGVDKLSMSASAIPAAKGAIRHYTLPEAQALANDVLALETLAAVVECLASRDKHN